MIKKLRNAALKLAAVIQILALTLLISCSSLGVNASANVCHATGDSTNPYEQVTLDSTALLNEHRMHTQDIFPVPVNGCPTVLVEVVDRNITICHATNSVTNPYEEITVNINGLDGHGEHDGDIIPMPVEGCTAPPILANPDEVAVCHVTGDSANPYDVVMVNSTELDAYVLQNPNDINPAPLTGCPAYLVEVIDGNVTFCHANDDTSKSFEEIEVNANGLDGHGDHKEDVFQTSEGAGCPASVLNDGKILICHVTSSSKNPYVAILVSVNGLNGHDKHTGDIIPAPADGCPTTKP
jgi:hypothetical protein